MLARDPPVVEVARVDLDLLLPDRVVGDVDLHRAVAEGLHQLVVLELAVLGLVGVAEDDLVDVGLGELLGLDLVLLRRAQEVVEEGHVELQDLDELDDAAVGDVQLAVEVEGARVGVGAVLGDLAVVDVAGQLGGVLVLLVLGLEGADADAVLLGQDQALHHHVADHALPVPVVLGQQVLIDLPAEGAEVAGGADPVVLAGQPPVDLGVDRRLGLQGNEVERLLVHGAPLHRLVAAGGEVGAPAVGIEGALLLVRVDLEPLLQQPGDGGLGGAHRAVQEQDALLRAVAVGRGLDVVDEPHERSVEPEDGVAAVVDGIVEEPVVGVPLVLARVLGHPVREDHVVEPLVGVARHPRVRHDDLHVVGERARPVPLAITLEILLLLDEAEEDVRPRRVPPLPPPVEWLASAGGVLRPAAIISARQGEGIVGRTVMQRAALSSHTFTGTLGRV